MHYEFPVITDIEQVREAIKGRPEFIEAVRDDYIVFNYLNNLPDTFPPVTNEQEAILRECRGLIFSKDGKVLSRRYHKFFNMNERPETRIGEFDVDQPHVILEKLDGSMLSFIEINGEPYWATKMGAPEFHKMVSEFIQKSSIDYVSFCREIVNSGFTPIFEFISRRAQIVIDYPEENLILTAIRHNITGEYIRLHQ